MKSKTIQLHMNPNLYKEIRKAAKAREKYLNEHFIHVISLGLKYEKLLNGKIEELLD